jgi:EmrB/QacA subfamily drug resistance transporter
MEPERAAERSTLFVTTLTAFMSPFMFSAVNVALPTLQKELSLDAVQMSWIATTYLVSMAISLVPSGKIGDIYGRKLVFVLGMMIFTLASTLAAVSTSFIWFIALRAIQGIGVAMFSTTAMAIITAVFPLQRRGQALGIYVAAVYIGLSAGPFLGGLLVQHLGWRSIFLAMLPLGLISVILTLRFLKEEWAEARGERLDLAGSALYAAAIFAIVFGVTRLPTIQAYALVVGGAAVMAAFVIRQQRIDYPVFDISLFRTNHVFAFSSLAALINYAATSATAFLISLFLQYIKALDAQSAGVVLVSQPIVQAVLSPLAGRLSDRVQPRLIASAGMAVTVIGLAIFARLDATTPLWLIVCNLMVMGVGFSLFSSPNMSAIMGAVEKKSYGIASGALATMRLLGQMMSMAIATVVLSLFMGREAIRPAIYPQFLHSVSVLFTFFAILCLVGVYFSMFRGKLRVNAPKAPVGKGGDG